MNLKDVTPALFMKNEEYWVWYVLRDLLPVFDRVIVLDTGSQDATVTILKDLASKHPNLELVLEDYGSDPNKIGNSPNVLRGLVKTWWMMLLAGDEIVRADQLAWLPNSGLNPHDHRVGMIRGINIADVDGKLKRREDEFNADKFFDPTIHWGVTEYPFEGYEQHKLVELGVVHYLPGDSFYYWHVRNTHRSDLDGQTYFRQTKFEYYPTKGKTHKPPKDWLGEPGPWPNPYVGGAEE